MSDTKTANDTKTTATADMAPDSDEPKVELVAMSIIKSGGQAQLKDDGTPTGMYVEAPTYIVPGEMFRTTVDEAERLIGSGVATRLADLTLQERTRELAEESAEQRSARLKRIAAGKEPAVPEPQVPEWLKQQGREAREAIPAPPPAPRATAKAFKDK